ncbi:MAG: hypothetical protein KJ645_14660 [Planctomycetes bacterium]|nr:hypothetical protein [Planctomycetota bacterium]
MFHGHSDKRTLGAALGRFPALLLVVQAFLLVLLCLMSGLKRFGVPIPPKMRRGRGPREVVTVSAKLLSHGERTDTLVAQYINDVIGDLTLRFKSSKSSSDLGQAEMLDALALRRGFRPYAKTMVCAAREIGQGKKFGERAALRLAAGAWKFRNQLISLVLFSDVKLSNRSRRV